MTTSIAANKPKAAGRTTATIPNTILNGKGVPLASLGINGDFYIDTRSLLIYGPKTNGKWPIPQNLQGPVGAPGVAGLAGKNGGEGKSVSSASTVTGPTGAQGEKGDKGETGASGGSGAPGSAGGVGPKGDTGSPGAAGGAGTGSPGATGATGAAGAVGAKGETGTAGTIGAPGTVGPSNVYTGTFNFPDIQGSVGSSQISVLSGFKAGVKYLVDIQIVTYQPTRNMDNAIPMGLTISNNLGTALLWYKYQTFDGTSYRSGIGSTRYEYLIKVQVTLDLTSSVDGSIDLQIYAGYDTSVHVARSEASYVATLVGSIGAL
jgi:hypothetical protein